MIQPMGNNPYAAPGAATPKAFPVGMRKTKMTISSDETRPSTAAQCVLILEDA